MIPALISRSKCVSLPYDLTPMHNFVGTSCFPDCPTLHGSENKLGGKDKLASSAWRLSDDHSEFTAHKLAAFCVPELQFLLVAKQMRSLLHVASLSVLRE